MRLNAPQEFAEVKAMHAAGMGPYAISRQLNIPAGTIRGWLEGDYPPAERVGRVPNAPLREALEASGLTHSAVCYRLGWVRSKGSSRPADVSRLTRGLGIRPYSNPSGVKTYQSTLEIERAKEICEALGVDFDKLYPQISVVRKRRSAGRCSCCRLALARKMGDELCGFCREVLGARDVATCTA